MAEPAGSVFELNEWPEDLGREQVGEDYVGLLEVLTERDQDISDVDHNVGRAIASPNTHVLGIAQVGHVISTATVSVCPILTGEGARIWIDDVVTNPNNQGLGYSKQIMNSAEELAAQYGSEVYLTSSVKRGPARAGYEKRGYGLLNEADEPKVVFRSTTIGKSEERPQLEAQLLRSNFTEEDVASLAELLEEDPEVIARNLSRATESPTTRVFVSRDSRGNISGVAVGNETPIPVGKKPWIDNIAGATPEDAHAALLAAGTWMGSGYKHVNIVASPDQEFGEGFTVRPSGLYVKRLGSLATTA